MGLLHSRAFRWLGFIGLSAIAVYSIYAEWLGLARLHLLRYDFAFFYYAFQVVLRHQSGLTLYHMSTEQSFLASLGFPLRSYNQYVYPPQFAVVWSFLGKLPFAMSAEVWLLISLVLCVLGLYLLVRLIWPESNWRTTIVLILAGVSIMPVQVDLGAGNVNSVLFGLAALTYYLLYHSRRAWLAGIPLGLAIVFKVTPLAILVYLLMRGHWRTGISSILTVTLLSVWTNFTLRGNSLVYYATHFFSFGQTSMKNGPAPYNQSLLGVLQDFHNHHLLPWVSSIQSVVFLVYVLIVALAYYGVFRLTPMTPKLDIALSSLSLLLFSPLVEEMHMIFVLPALLVLAHFGWSQEGLRGWYSRNLAKFVAIGSLLVMSLPITFILNLMTHRWPQLYWLHTQMLWVLLAVSFVAFSLTWTARGKEGSLAVLEQGVTEPPHG